MKQDVLFMTWNCAECCRIKVEFPEFGKYSFSDDEVGKDGQNLVVIQTYSNVAANFALCKVGDFADGSFTPAIVTHDGIKITNIDEIISYLKESYD